MKKIPLTLFLGILFIQVITSCKSENPNLDMSLKERANAISEALKTYQDTGINNAEHQAKCFCEMSSYINYEIMIHCLDKDFDFMKKNGILASFDNVTKNSKDNSPIRVAYRSETELYEQVMGIINAHIKNMKHADREVYKLIESKCKSNLRNFQNSNHQDRMNMAIGEM